MQYSKTWKTLILISFISLALFACSSINIEQGEQASAVAEILTTDPSAMDLESDRQSEVIESESQIQTESKTTPALYTGKESAAAQQVDSLSSNEVAPESDIELSPDSVTADSTPPTIVETSVDGAAFLESFSAITAVFSEPMLDPAGNTDSDDVTNPTNYLLVAWDENKIFDTESCKNGIKGDDYKVAINSATYDNTTNTIELGINNGENLLNSKYRLFFCGTTTLRDLDGNPLNGGSDVVRTFLVNTKSPEVKSITLEDSPFAPFNRFTVTFTEDMYDPDGNYDEHDITNPLNFRLIEAGTNGVRNTASCQEDLGADDVEINLDALIDPEIELYSISYNADTFTVTIYANSGAYLPNGKYRFMVCGRGEYQAVDVNLNPLNAGADYLIDFVINGNVTDNLPTTGFTPDVVTNLPPAPVKRSSLTDAEIWIEIPSLGIDAPVVGVPQEDGEWDVQWLGDDVGWLEGSAFPLWDGNSVLTGHVVNASGLPGIFDSLDQLRYGNMIILHAYGEQYIFEIRTTELVQTWETEKVLRHEEYNWLTLMTCEDWVPAAQAYQYRRVVRAVLVRVDPD